MVRLLAGILATATLLAACAPAAAPPAAPPQRPNSGGSSTTAAASAPAADAYRQQVIDGARAEGTANILLSSIWTPEALREVEDAVEREYGVRIKTNRTPSTNYGAHAATLISELQANATPSYDLHQSSDSSSAVLLQADALEPVNWAALLPAGTPPEVVQGDNRLVVTYTSFTGMMYDPAVVPESDVPRSLKDLANPRWRGKAMLNQSPDTATLYAYKWGRDATLATLRDVMANGTTVGTYFDQETRYTSKEVAMVQVSSIIYHSARLRGIPGSFALLDFIIDQAHHLSIPRHAAHPNAAKLLAAVIAGPEGQRIAAQYIGAGNRYYGGSWEQQLAEQAKAAGLTTASWWTDPGALDYLLSPTGDEMKREIATVLQGG